MNKWCKVQLSDWVDVSIVKYICSIFYYFGKGRKRIVKKSLKDLKGLKCLKC